MSRSAAFGRLAGVAALVLTAALVRTDPDRVRSVTVVRDVAYRTGAGATDRHRLDLYVPPGQGWPLAMVIHGGDWRSGARFTSPGGRYDNVARALADHGIAVALVGYRLTDGGPTSIMHPGHAEDIATALAFARSWLVARGTRPGETFLVGHESGAHLAALVATNPRFLASEGLALDAVRGVVGLSGTYRVDPLGSDDADVFGNGPDGRLDASPYHQVAELAQAPSARFLLLIASPERPGLADDARDFQLRVAAAGGTARLETMPRDHDALVDRIGLPGDQTTERIVEAILEGRGATRTPTPTPTERPSATPSPAPTATPTPADAAPPGPPASGPGSPALQPVATRRMERGNGGAGWVAWWPAVEAPAAPWPVIAFFPDDGEGRAIGDYAAWMEHLARGGAVVLAPADGLGRAPDPVAQASAMVDRALGDLGLAGVRADGDWRVYAGHGTGADVAARLASEWYRRGLPAPRALFAVGPRLAGGQVAGAHSGRLPGDAMAVLLTLGDGDRDRLAEDRAWHAMRGLPGRQRAHVDLQSDGYGQPRLVADGNAPLTEGASGQLDALDWRGTWRWLDALVACRRDGRWCGHVLDDPVLQVDLGRWSDGWPVASARLGIGPPRAPSVVVPFAER